MAVEVLSMWHQFVRHKNSTILERILADDVLFISPILHTPQVGKVRTQQYLTAARHVLSLGDFRYVREISDAYDAMLEFQLEIQDIQVNGVDIIKWNDDGKITEFKVMLRPLQAINFIHKKMAELLLATG